jgi:polar amino acid transport system substrate-binding protein
MERFTRYLLKGCLAGVLSLLLAAANADEQGTLIISTLDNRNFSNLAMSQLMVKVYATLGYKVQIQPLPSRRALVQANAGDYDGELYRVLAISDEFPNLLPVPTSLGVMQYQAFAMRPIPLDGWASLSGFRLGSEMGIKHVEYNTVSMKVSYATKPEQLFRMLKAGRIDVVVIEMSTARKAFDTLILEGELLDGIQMIGVVDEVEVHTFLHRKHAALVPRVDRVLRELASRGLLHKTWQQTVNP